MPLMGSMMSRGLGLGTVMVFIDGGYLSKYAIDHYEHNDINFLNLGNFLAKHAVSPERLEPQLARIYYYDGVPDEKDAELVEEKYRKDVLKKIMEKTKTQTDYLDKIEMFDLVEVKRGHQIISKKETPRQKGIDTLMAIDMITKAYEGQYDYAVLLAGDADFIEVIKAVKNTGPKVVGAYFTETNVSSNFLKSFDRRIVMNEKTMTNNNITKK